MNVTDFKKNKELEEARKAGIVEPAKDEEGNEINPHIPQFMSSAPWYLNNDQPTLRHQKNWKQGPNDDNKWYERGKKVFQATKFRKGTYGVFPRIYFAPVVNPFHV